MRYHHQWSQILSIPFYFKVNYRMGDTSYSKMSLPLNIKSRGFVRTIYFKIEWTNHSILKYIWKILWRRVTFLPRGESTQTKPRYRYKVDSILHTLESYFPYIRKDRGLPIIFSVTLFVRLISWLNTKNIVVRPSGEMFSISKTRKYYGRI